MEFRELDLSEQSLDLNLNYRRREPFGGGTTPGAPYAAELGALLMSLQWGYEEICDALAIAPHDLAVLEIQHPNISISLQGLGEPINALRDLLMAVPELVANVWTIPDRVREKKAEFRANTEYQEVIKDVLSQGRNIPKDERVEYFKRAFGYRLRGSTALRMVGELVPWSIEDVSSGATVSRGSSATSSASAT
jgi:hypothetical protein